MQHLQHLMKRWPSDHPTQTLHRCHLRDDTNLTTFLQLLRSRKYHYLSVMGFVIVILRHGYLSNVSVTPCSIKGDGSFLKPDIRQLPISWPLKQTNGINSRTKRYEGFWESADKFDLRKKRRLQVDCTGKKNERKTSQTDCVSVFLWTM